MNCKLSSKLLLSISDYMVSFFMFFCNNRMFFKWSRTSNKQLVTQTTQFYAQIMVRASCMVEYKRDDKINIFSFAWVCLSNWRIGNIWIRKHAVASSVFNIANKQVINQIQLASMAHFKWRQRKNLPNCLFPHLWASTSSYNQGKFSFYLAAPKEW